MSIDRKTRWLSTPAHPSHWPAPVRWLRVWGRVWAYLAAVMFLVLPVFIAFTLMTQGSSLSTPEMSFSPWHTSYGLLHWRFALAVALIAGGVGVSLLFLLGRSGIRVFAPYAVLVFLVQRVLDPYDAMQAQWLSQHPGGVAGTTRVTGGVPGIAMNAILMGSIFLAWLHLAIVPDPTPSDRVCQSCGYDLAGLPADAEHCPECGKSRLPAAKVSPRALSGR